MSFVLFGENIILVPSLKTMLPVKKMLTSVLAVPFNFTTPLLTITVTPSL